MEIIEVMEITLAVDAKEIDKGYPLDKDNLNLRKNYYSAVSRAMEYFHDFNSKNYFVISVEGVYCCARLNPFTGSFDTDVFPFDEKQAYPMQGLLFEPRFWRDK